MIYPVAGMLGGLVIGALRARMRGGKWQDMLQWALVHALIGAMIGLFALIFIERSYV